MTRRASGATTHHQSAATLTSGTVVGGGVITETQLQDTAIVLDFGANARFNFRSDAASTPTDNVYVIADATATNGKWLREGLAPIATGVTMAYPQFGDNFEDIIDVAVSGVVTGKTYVIAATNAITKVELRAEQVVTNGTLQVFMRNNTGAPISAGSFTLNVYQAGA